MFNLVSFILLLTCALPASSSWYYYQQNAMGTKIIVKLWHTDEKTARECSDKVFSEVSRIDVLMNPAKSNSELTRINREAALRPVSISTEMQALLEKSLEFSRLTHGIFDITFASVGQFYDYRKKIQPSINTIKQTLPQINYQHIKLQKTSIKFNRPGVSLDLGGIAKGYAVDRSIRILQDCGINEALVSAGGDSRLLGDKLGQPWMMAIQHPRQKQAIAVRLPLTNSAISTSGDYERFFFHQGERVHHIIDPKTGKSAIKSWSATVIGPDTTSTDALSTSVFILGADKGMSLIESLPEFEAVIIDNTGKMRYSSGLQSADNNNHASQ